MKIKERKKLRDFVTKLTLIKGRHTELVSVYIPTGYDIQKIINHLQQEQGTASNIKDARTRKHVQDSLEKTIRHLRLFRKTPENGLAVFAGNTSKQEGKIDIEVFSIEPPEPITTRLYRCDHTFVLDILKDMMEHKEIYGLIAVDKREATLGVLKGTSIQKLTKLTSGVPGKIKAGGQSAARFARLREGAAKEFYKRIANAANKEFLGKKNLKGILIGGPGHSKEEFKDYLNQQLKDKILGLKDITYTDEQGLYDLVDKSQDTLAKEIIAEEKALMQKFFTLLAKEPNKVTYGLNEVKKALEYSAVEILLLSEDLDESLINELEEKAESTKADIQIISLETREGSQLKDLSGVAAILRFAIE